MNWNEVVKSLRADAASLQEAQLKVPRSQVAATAMCGTSAVVLSKLADAIERGIAGKAN